MFAPPYGAPPLSGRTEGGVVGHQPRKASNLHTVRPPPAAISTKALSIVSNLNSG